PIPRAPSWRSTGARHCSPPGRSARPRTRSRSWAAGSLPTAPRPRACGGGTPASPPSARCSPIHRRCAPPPPRSPPQPSRWRPRPRGRGRGGAPPAGGARARWARAGAPAGRGGGGAGGPPPDGARGGPRRAHDRRRANAVLASVPLAALWGPGPVTRASGRCLDVVRVLRITQGAPAVEAVALRCQAVLEALRGRAEAAERMIAASRHMVEELGITQGLLETECLTGFIALIEGDTAAAEQSLRAAYEGFRHHGLGIDAARAAALLRRAILAQGRALDATPISPHSHTPT